MRVNLVEQAVGRVFIQFFEDFVLGQGGFALTALQVDDTHIEMRGYKIRVDPYRFLVGVDFAFAIAQIAVDQPQTVIGGREIRFDL